MTNNPFNPADTAAAIVNAPREQKEKPKYVNPAAVPHKTNPAIVVKPNISVKSSFPAPGDPYWKQHPLVTEHKDGAVRAWGEDSSAMRNPNLLPKQMLPPPPISDKAKGYSNTYYNPVDQNKGKAIPEIKSNNFH